MEIYSTPVQYQYNNQMTNFKCRRFNKPDNWEYIEKLVEKEAKCYDILIKIGEFLGFLPKRRTIKIAKDYNELKNIINDNISIAKHRSFMQYSLISSIEAYIRYITKPKEIRKQLKTEYKQEVEELINKGYNYTLQHKNELDTLTKNADCKNQHYLKGMLKALKELGLIK